MTSKSPLSMYLAAACILLALTAACRHANALINPNFTPVHLVNQSGQILSLELAADAKGEITVRLLKCLKGKVPGKPPALDLTKTPKPQVQALLKTIGTTGKRPALLFSGKYREETEDAAPEDEEPPGDEYVAGLLHVSGRWFRLFQRTPGRAWMLEKVDDRVQATWAGGTDMLLRAVKYILTDPRCNVPVQTGASWGDKVKVATLSGKVHAAVTVDLIADGGGPPAVHLLCETGDRIVQWSKADKAFTDRTGALKLDTKSRRAAWADFNADGRIDLASWDGKSLSIRLRTKDGTFADKGSQIELRGGCIGLSALDVGAAGRPGILVSTQDAPLLLVPRADGSFEPKPLGRTPSGLGRTLPCLAADLDGDGVADILQPLAMGALFYKGKTAGRFEPPKRCGNVATGKGRAGACLGDYDADGLLDVFVAAEGRCFLWQNLGGGRFAETLHLSGEVAYISKAGGVGCGTCDVNNDGRQDVLILYADRSPQIFFNRGFRSFGHSHMLDLAEKNLLPQAEKGQQAGLAADLDADGTQDMLLVVDSGEVWVFFRETPGRPPASLRVALPPTGPLTGPVRVVGWQGSRCLGAWNLVRGTSEAFFARRSKGPITLRWKLPGAAPQQKRVIVLRPTRFVLPR